MYLFALFLVIYEFTTYAANDMIMPGMIQVVNDFHASQSFVALSMSFYILGNCLFLFMAGFLSERFGKRRVLLFGNLLFLLFTLAIIFSQTIYQFMTWRFLQGVGLSMIAIGYAVIHQHLNDKAAIKLAALMANISILAPLLGPMIGSLIMSYYSWNYVFILTAMLGLMTLIGLYHTAPGDHLQVSTSNFKDTMKQYGSILKNREFLLGAFSSVFAIMTLLIWISQAPNLIFFQLKQDYTHYVIYQFVSIGGLSLSSFVMQYIVGRFRMYGIVKWGNAFLFIGTCISLIGYRSINIFVIGLFLYSLGMGLANGCIMRLIMSIQGYSHGIIASILGCFQTLFFALGITVMNEYYSHFNYSLWSFAASSFGFGLIAFILINKFIANYQQRGWQ